MANDLFNQGAPLGSKHRKRIDLNIVEFRARLELLKPQIEVQINSPRADVGDYGLQTETSSVSSGQAKLVKTSSLLCFC